jgi:hypothetical protein
MVAILYFTSVLFGGIAAHTQALAFVLSDGYILGTSLVSAVTAAPGDAIADKVNEIVETLKAVGRPVAILGIVLLALSWLAAGVLPEWAQQNRGVLVKMLMGGILLGIAPDVVGLVLQ